MNPSPLSILEALASAGQPQAVAALVSRPVLYLGCTIARHRRLGVHAVVNARGGQQWRNDDTREAVEIQRDARKIRDRVASRTRFYQFNSRFFRRHQARLAHLLSDYND